MQVISLHNNLHFILIEKRERTEGIRYLTPFASGFDIHSMTSVGNGSAPRRAKALAADKLAQGKSGPKNSQF